MTATGVVALSSTSVAVETCPPGIAHRGNAYTGAPVENSLAAFNTAFGSGAKWVESDVHFTSDNVPVIMHNATVEQTTNGTGAIANMTAAQFTALTFDADPSQHPPTLDQLLAVITAAPDRNLLLESKALNVTTTQQQVLLTKLAGLEARVHLQAFANRLAPVQSMKTANPALTISVLGYDPISPSPTGIASQNLEYTYISASEVAALHTQGLKVKAWTANNSTAWANLRSMGVDAIITNKVRDYLTWAASTCPTEPPPPPPPVTEYVTNKSVETDLAGWTGLWTSTSTNTRVTGGYDGAYAIRSQNGATGTAQHGFSSSPRVLDGTPGKATVAGKTYVGSAQVKPGVTGQKINLYLRERNAAGTTVGSKTIVKTTSGTGWQSIAGTYTAVGTGNTITYTLWATSGAGVSFYADLFSFTG
ncbi:glycerophosphodiester phosphodiesterase family protein [Kribbella caucasensis]|nr:glycerophosphodiester phosphodiesterase family protein [Kribbella sp. VKM Ac-2527]